MRFHVVIRYIALALLLNSLFMIISGIISAFNGDGGMIPLFYSGLVTALFGIFPLIYVPAAEKITNKEGLLIVVLSWLLSCLVGTLPYILWGGGVFTFTNAWFESVSGFTTTGATILSDIEAVPMGLLFWRAATHWIGGIGIIIFVLAVLPFLGIAELVLFRSEVSSMAAENFRHRARKAIQILAGVYVGLTLLETIALMLLGMNLFDAVTHSFATIATGGFSPKNASVAYYNSPAIEIVIIIFMLLSGIHFAVLFAAATGRVKDLWNNTIVRYYILANIIGALIAAFNTWGSNYNSFWDALRYSAFQIVSIGTSTGFATADSAVWPFLSHTILIFFTLQCACAGSTSGGIKVDRVVILSKAFVRQLKSLMHPNAVFPVRLDNHTVSDDVVYKSVLFIGIYLFIVFISTMLIAAMNVDLLTSFTATIASMGNVGPGLGSVGSVDNYGHLPMAAKWILTLVMLLGRLEIYSLFIFFTPRQWKKSVAY